MGGKRPVIKAKPSGRTVGSRAGGEGGNRASGRSLATAHSRAAGAGTARLTCALGVMLNLMCTPGMGVNLWGASPLYVNPVNMLNILIKVLAEGKGGTARDRLKEAQVQSYEPTNRNGIQGPVSG
jgi:hypothetical protein